MEKIDLTKYGKLSNGITRLTKRSREYPLVDKLVMIYVAVVVVAQVLLQISPVMTFLASTPFNSIQSYLGILGGCLILVDLFTTKRIWQGKYCLLLYGICAVAVLASIRTISYGVKENLFKLCWAAIQFALFYSCAHRMEREELKSFFKKVYVILLIVWLISCAISLFQFALQIKYAYVVNPLSQDSSANRQGFYDNRLFGIFHTLNHSAYTSTVLFVVGLFYIIKARRTSSKVLLSLANVVLLLHIILSGSRSAKVALIVCLVCIGFFFARNSIKKNGWKKVIIPVVAAAFAGILCVTSLKVIRQGLTYVPVIASKIDIVQKIQQKPSIKPGDKNEHKLQIDYDENLLNREGLTEDPSNGRLTVWTDYLSLYKDVGPIGLSPDNYMEYIYERYEDLFIVNDIKVNYPDKYESKIIYHPHSGYLTIYACTGWIGTICMIVFMVLCIIKVLKAAFAKQKLTKMFICTVLLVGAVSISAVFDVGIFFQNNPQTTVFWIALGILMLESNVISQSVQAADEKEKILEKEV